MTSVQKDLIILTILDEMEVLPPTVGDVPGSGSKTLVVGGRVYKVMGKRKEK